MSLRVKARLGVWMLMWMRIRVKGESEGQEKVGGYEHMGRGTYGRINHT